MALPEEELKEGVPGAMERLRNRGVGYLNITLPELASRSFLAETWPARPCT